MLSASFVPAIASHGVDGGLFYTAGVQNTVRASSFDAEQGTFGAGDACRFSAGNK